MATNSVVASADQTCTYTINVQTGARADSGTDAIIGIVLADQSEEYIEIKDLVSWGGKMPEGHDYFENGNLDIFSGTERCLPGPVCFMRLNSDNSGYKPGWYVVYVDVTTSKPGSLSKHQRFTVEQWLAMSRRISYMPSGATVLSEIKKNLYSIV